MKNQFLVLAAFILTVGCAESGKKTAEKMNGEAEIAQAKTNQGAVEYLQATQATESIAIEDMTLEELSLTRKKFVSARENLLEGRAKYKQILKMENDNKESVKLIGKQSVLDSISNIESIVLDIDKRIKEIDTVTKKKVAKKKAS